MNPIVLRVLALVGLVALIVVAARALWAGGVSMRQGTFRPRPRAAEAGDPPGADERFILKRSDLLGLRDPYLGGPIDPDRELCRCAGCQSVYDSHSVAELKRANGGRCVNCDGRRFNGVEVVDDV